MGFLAAGLPVPFEDSKEHLKYVRKHGVLQFIAAYKKVMDSSGDVLFWGDEVEYALLEKVGQGEERTVKLSLTGIEVMTNLKTLEDTQHNKGTNGGAWHQEYGSWMIEGTPSLPYSGFARDLVEVELNMRLRRSRILAALGPNQIAPSSTNFPLLGTDTSFTIPETTPGGVSSDSQFVSDDCINPHPRFAALTANIRARRGSKVDIRVPLFKDTNTPEFQTPVPAQAEEPLPFHFDSRTPDWPLVHGDCMAFGMGCCCLQVTFQSRDVHESRFMFDQLAGLSPIMLALTAATPLFKGRIVDTDVRWSIISQSVDDRTPAERGLAPDAVPDSTMAGDGVRRLDKSRYDSISCYLSPDTPEEFNDVECEVDEEMRQELLAHDMDAVLARHVSHLFTRDPLVMFQGQITELPDDGSRTDHWESIQSTNWQTMRWKPPPPNDPSNPNQPHIGWRTEFRSMEVQLTDFENAAYTVFIVLLTRVLLVFDLDLRMPLSKVDINMRRAHEVQPVKTQQWWFRKDVTHGSELGEELFEEMTMQEIMGGRGDYFPGLVPLIHAYLEHIQCDKVTFKRVDMYLTFITERASGTIQTDADWIRSFVTSHPEYRGDSVVSPAVAHDLMEACDAVGQGVLQPEELLGKAAGQIDLVRKEEAYGSPLIGEKLSKNCRAALVRKITADRVPVKERLNSDADQASAAQDKYLADMREAAEAGLRDF